jgi:putative resolvase
MSQKLVSIGKAADILGVHTDTLREWDKENKLVPVKTLGNHRRYRLADIESLCGDRPKKITSDLVRVATYARVSSHEQKQKGDLERQAGRILTYCAEKQYHVIKSFEEIGSGMSDTRLRLRQLFKLVEVRKIDKVVIEHKDRLARFNFQFLADFFESYDVEIEWIGEVLGKTYEQELVEDMLTLMSSFSNKIYGRRGAENRKKKKELEIVNAT